MLKSSDWDSPLSEFMDRGYDHFVDTRSTVFGEIRKALDGLPLPGRVLLLAMLESRATSSLDFLRGTGREVPHMINEARFLASEQTNAVDEEANRMVSLSNMLTPNPENCKKCPARETCPNAILEDSEVS